MKSFKCIIGNEYSFRRALSRQIISALATTMAKVHTYIHHLTARPISDNFMGAYIYLRQSLSGRLSSSPNPCTQSFLSSRACPFEDCSITTAFLFPSSFLTSPTLSKNFEPSCSFSIFYLICHSSLISTMELTRPQIFLYKFHRCLKQQISSLYCVRSAFAFASSNQVLQTQTDACFLKKSFDLSSTLLTLYFFAINDSKVNYYSLQHAGCSIHRGISSLLAHHRRCEHVTYAFDQMVYKVVELLGH